MHQAPEILYEATKCFFGNLNKVKLKSALTTDEISFEQRMEEAKKDFFSRVTRKKLTKHLRAIKNNTNVDVQEILPPDMKEAINFIKGEDLKIDQLRDCIKQRNQALFAQLAVELGEQILQQYNQSPTATFPKIKEQGKDTGEGNKVKKAIRDLRILNKILILNKELSGGESKTSTELINIFKHDFKNIAKAAYPNTSQDSTFDNVLKILLKELFNLNDETISLDNIQFHISKMSGEKINTDNVGGLFNDLFDFKKSKIRDAEKGELDGELVDEGKKIALKEPLNTLYEVTTRHINFMRIAFSSLKTLDTQIWEKIVEGFYKKIIDKPESENGQGWGSWKYTLEANLDVDLLKKGVEEYKQLVEKNTSEQITVFQTNKANKLM